MRLIDADVLDDAMYHEAFKNDSSYDERNPMAKWDSGLWIRYKMFENAIAEAPTIDAIPIRPQGEWIEVRAFDAFGGDEAAWMAHGNPIAFHYCSECKEQTRLDEFGEEMMSKYCPNCGAKMKGADDE